MKAFENVLRNPRSIQARRELRDEWIRNQDPRAELLDLEVTGRDGIKYGPGDGMRLNKAARLVYKRGNSPEIAGPIAALISHFEYSYGLVTHAGMTALEFNAKARALINSAPLLSLNLGDPGDARAVVDNPALSQILDLMFFGRGIDDEFAVALSRSESLKEVRVLTLPSGTITGRGLSALRSTKNLPNLLSLEVTGNPCQVGLMEVGGCFYVVGEAGKPFLDEAETIRMNADAHEIMWPPVLTDYAWID